MQTAGDVAREQGPDGRPVPLSGRIVDRFVAHDRVAEHKVVLRRDGDPGEGRVLRIEATVEDADPHARAVDTGIRERAEAQLAIRHFGRPEDGIAARRTCVAGGGGRGARGEPEAAERLDAAQAGVQGERP